MRQNEIMNGIAIYDSEGKLATNSKKAAQTGIAQVLVQIGGEGLAQYSPSPYLNYNRKTRMTTSIRSEAQETMDWNKDKKTERIFISIYVESQNLSHIILQQRRNSKRQTDKVDYTLNSHKD